VSGGNPIKRVINFVADTVRDVAVEPLVDTAGTLLSPVTDAIKPESPQPSVPAGDINKEEKSEEFQEMPKTAELAERKKDEGNRASLDAQRAGLEAKRRKSLFSTSRSKSLLG
jgi:hypothetical protein